MVCLDSPGARLSQIARLKARLAAKVGRGDGEASDADGDSEAELCGTCGRESCQVLPRASEATPMARGARG